MSSAAIISFIPLEFELISLRCRFYLIFHRRNGQHLTATCHSTVPAAAAAAAAAALPSVTNCRHLPHGINVIELKFKKVLNGTFVGSLGRFY